MGEKQNKPFQLSFNPSLTIDFQGPASFSATCEKTTGELPRRTWTTRGIL